MVSSPCLRVPLGRSEELLTFSLVLIDEPALICLLTSVSGVFPCFGWTVGSGKGQNQVKRRGQNQVKGWGLTVAPG